MPQCWLKLSLLAVEMHAMSLASLRHLMVSRGTTSRFPTLLGVPPWSTH